MMGFLANLRLRRKLLIAMAPLAAMVVVAGLYSSFESKWIDTSYSNLIDNDIKTLRSVTAARELTARSGMFLYQLIAEPYADRKQLISGDLDKTQADYQAAISEALRQSPKRATELRAAAALYEEAMTDARAARAAALAGNREKATEVMRLRVDLELQQARQAGVNIVE